MKFGVINSKIKITKPQKSLRMPKAFVKIFGVLYGYLGSFYNGLKPIAIKWTVQLSLNVYYCFIKKPTQLIGSVLIKSFNKFYLVITNDLLKIPFSVFIRTKYNPLLWFDKSKVFFVFNLLSNLTTSCPVIL